MCIRDSSYGGEWSVIWPEAHRTTVRFEEIPTTEFSPLGRQAIAVFGDDDFFRLSEASQACTADQPAFGLYSFALLDPSSILRVNSSAQPDEFLTPALPDQCSDVMGHPSITGSAFDLPGIGIEVPSVGIDPAAVNLYRDTPATVPPVLEGSLVFQRGIDADRDGYTSTDGNDCDDNDSSVNPGQNEIPGNNTDDNCDGVTL